LPSNKTTSSRIDCEEWLEKISISFHQSSCRLTFIVANNFIIRSYTLNTNDDEEKMKFHIVKIPSTWELCLSIELIGLQFDVKLKWHLLPQCLIVGVFLSLCFSLKNFFSPFFAYVCHVSLPPSNKCHSRCNFFYC
jgi:hypothetical protein